jgi:hypothetical protein
MEVLIVIVNIFLGLRLRLVVSTSCNKSFDLSIAEVLQQEII